MMWDRKAIYSRFQKGSSLPRALTMLAWLVALILACVNEGDSQDGTYTPSIVMVSLTIVAPGLIAIGLDWLFMLYALATLIVVSLPLGKNTTLKNMWVPLTYSISCIAGHWMKEKASVKYNMQLDIEDLKMLSEMSFNTQIGGVITLILAILASPTDGIWLLGLFCLGIYIGLLEIIPYIFRTRLKEVDEIIDWYMISGNAPQIQRKFENALEARLVDNHQLLVGRLAASMGSTIFLGALWEKKREESFEESWEVWIALPFWILTLLTIHLGNRGIQKYYVYKGD